MSNSRGYKENWTLKKGRPGSKRLRVNAKKTKMMISSEKATEVRRKKNFLYTAC